MSNSRSGVGATTIRGCSEPVVVDVVAVVAGGGSWRPMVVSGMPSPGDSETEPSPRTGASEGGHGDAVIPVIPVVFTTVPTAAMGTVVVAAPPQWRNGGLFRVDTSRVGAWGSTEA